MAVSDISSDMLKKTVWSNCDEQLVLNFLSMTKILLFFRKVWTAVFGLLLSFKESLRNISAGTSLIRALKTTQSLSTLKHGV